MRMVIIASSVHRAQDVARRLGLAPGEAILATDEARLYGLEETVPVLFVDGWERLPGAIRLHEFIRARRMPVFDLYDHGTYCRLCR